MQTFLSEQVRQTAEGREADAILRSCVHCGFCTAVCPTYQLLGDELDGPRGRIYLVKQLLEGRPVTAKTQLHLDRCLTCRACETACPSGVQYGRLADIGRAHIERQVPRTAGQRLLRRLLRAVLPHPRRFAAALGLGRLVKGALPAALGRKIPPRAAAAPWPRGRHPRRVILHRGCAQSVATPRTNTSAARVLDRLGVGAVCAAGEGCCGAVSYHLGAQEEGLAFMRRNIDAWWPHIEAGAETVVNASSACALMIKDYATVLRDDPRYAEKAQAVSGMARDLSELMAGEDLSRLQGSGSRGQRVAFHAPCTLQHGQGLAGIVEPLLDRMGYRLTEVRDGHLCCGSAGTYSILQRGLSRQLLADKVDALEADQPQIIATANVGCHLHLQSASRVPVRHWIELLDASGP